MFKLIRWAYRRATGLSDQELAARWSYYHFLTRSRARAYWHTLRN